ncbi:hypothetical protein EXS56_02865, partial [Candidatus Kaiserbacteria bacterium]|nr:hypothetical protein [Candidatus Kaiserbacteria bacterium]
MVNTMRVHRYVAFFLFSIILIGSASPLAANATPLIISQNSGVSQPYKTSFGIGFGINEPRYFVATSTLSSITAPISVTKSFLGTELYSFKLFVSYYGKVLDCKTPTKTLDEWGISRVIRDPYAPMVTIGPFTGTQCAVGIQYDVFTGGPIPITLRATRDGVDDGFLSVMGTNFRWNFTVSGADIPPPPPPDPCATPGVCASNVLFLPGIETSRLYRPDYVGGTDRLWEPNIDSDVQDLYMNADGSSSRFDVYTKERDVIDELPSGANIYKSFIGKMNELKTSDTINDWEPIAYDWRLSLDDILTYGHKIQDRIYYSGDLRATSTPYIIQELKRLAAASKTKKVTIVAHSNGGLLAKRLTELLGPVESAKIIDKMIFVAVPQAGTPASIPAGLHGYEQDILYGLITSKETARTLAKNAPMEYQLLPSAKYFTYVDDPVITFDASLTDWIARYGSSIHSQSSLHTFLTDTFGRVDSQTGDSNQPIQLNDPLLLNAESLHISLDNWTPPAGVQLTQIAGWGVPKTVSGLTYKKKGTGVTPEPNFTIDGDGTVVVPSALWTSTAASTTNYWVD